MDDGPALLRQGFDCGEIDGAGGEDLAVAVQAEDPRRPFERAQHHDDPPVVAEVRDRLGAAAHEVQVGERVLVEYPERLDRALRRDVDMAAGAGRGSADEEHPLRRDPRGQTVVDAVVELPH